MGRSFGPRVCPNLRVLRDRRNDEINVLVGGGRYALCAMLLYQFGSPLLSLADKTPYRRCLSP